MTTTCSQKLAFGFTLLSMALAIVTFTSPGIYVLRIPKNKKIEIDPALLPEQSKPSKLTPAHDPIVVKIPKTVILGCGLFYFQTCVKSDHDYDALIPNYASWGDDEYCELNTYHHAKHAARHLAEPLQGMDMEEIYKNIADIATFVMIEFLVEIGAAIVCLLISLITTARYYRGGRRRCLGLTGFITALLAGVLLAVATAKCVTLILQSKVLLSSNFDFDMREVTFRFPYGLLLSGIAAVFLFGSSLNLLLALTNKTVAVQTTYGIKPSEKTRIVPVNVIASDYFTSPGVTVTTEQ